MRKTIEVVGLMALGVLFWVTYGALNGPAHLPDRIPTHFDISGRPDAWGTLTMLWFLPAVGSGLYLLMTALGGIRFRRYNLPVRVTEGNLPLIQRQTGEMVALIKCEVLWLFVYLQWSIIQSARNRIFRISPLLIPVFLVVVFSTVGWKLAVLVQDARSREGSTSVAEFHSQ